MTSSKWAAMVNGRSYRIAVWRTCLGLSVAMGLGTGCSEENGAGPAPQEGKVETGTLNVPLVVTVGENVYRLSMSIDLFGDYYWDNISTDAYSDETSIRRSLPTGNYNAYMGGWQMYKEENGELFPVTSQLVSDYYSYFSIQNNATSTLSYTFETDGVRVVIGSGNLVVNVEVTEIEPACEPLGDTCGEGYWCPPAELTGRRLECVYVYGSAGVGDPCQSPTDCSANLSCFDFGAGAVCGALCPSDDFEETCSSGGTCTRQGVDYGVCVPEGGNPPESSGGGGFGMTPSPTTTSTPVPPTPVGPVTPPTTTR